MPDEKAKRWSSTLLASLLLFVLNWAVWAYGVVVHRDWSLTPIATALQQMEQAGDVWMAQLTAGMIAFFLIIVSLRIFLYLLLLEHDDVLQKELFEGNAPWLLRLELLIRCAAVIAVNFIYYSSTRKMGDFQQSLIVTTALVFVWDLVMVRRLFEHPTLKGVFQRDFFLLVCALLYFFVEQQQIKPAYTPVPFTIVASAGVAIFWSEMTSTYWAMMKRVCRARMMVLPGSDNDQ